MLSFWQQSVRLLVFQMGRTRKRKNCHCCEEATPPARRDLRSNINPPPDQTPTPVEPAEPEEPVPDEATHHLQDAPELTLEGLAAQLANLQETMVGLLTQRQAAPPSMPPALGSDTFLSNPPAGSFVAATMANPCYQSDTFPSQSSSLCAIPLAATVPIGLQQKIWANEFIELGMLLTRSDKQINRLVVDTTNSLNPIQVQPLPPRKIKSIEEWTDTFLIFVAIYCSAHTDQAPSLMKYMANVRDIAARGGDWMGYDSRFRQLRAHPGTCIPWDTFHPELWVKNSVRPQVPLTKTVGPGQKNKTSNLANVPNGFCFRFHGGGSCIPGCKLKHLCPTCGSKHPAISCGRYRSSQGHRLSQGSDKTESSHSFKANTSTPK